MSQLTRTFPIQQRHVLLAGSLLLLSLLALSIAASTGLAAWLGSLALSSPTGSAEAAGASLLFALAALGALEHIFLALPFRDGALWQWALPAHRRDTRTN